MYLDLAIWLSEPPACSVLCLALFPEDYSGPGRCIAGKETIITKLLIRVTLYSKSTNKFIWKLSPRFYIKFKLKLKRM